MRTTVDNARLAGIFFAAALTLLMPVQGWAETAAAPFKDSYANLRRDPGVFTLVNARGGLSYHDPMYILPLTYSPDFEGAATELIYQISLKQQLFKRSWYFSYTQRSFWQIYNGAASRPFRETNYNPEIFYRWKAAEGDWSGWGFDFGGDHESNGQTLPLSRSWNRLYFAPHYENGDWLTLLKTWYRLPESPRKFPNDPRGDDNPDIEDFYGYAELHVQRKFRDRSHQANLMLRGNPATGKAAFNLLYSWPSGDHGYWQIYAWHGYGESLIDYNRSLTRIGFGYALAR